MAAAVVLIGPAAAVAAGPGDTLLVSGPPGLGPLAPDTFAWNVSGDSLVEDDVTSIGVSADGTRVAFTSAADGMAPGIDPRFEYVFVKNRVTGAVTAIAPHALGNASHPTLSDDGSKVAFLSDAPNLAAGDTTRDDDVFVADVATGVVTLVTPGTTADVDDPVLSGNGQFVAFSTTQALVAPDAGTTSDVYRVDADGTDLVLASQTTTETQSNGSSSDPSISDDGSRIAFTSTATNLSPGVDGSSDSDVYVRAIGTGVTALVSRINALALSGNGPAGDPAISGNGAFVAYSSTSTDAAPGDTDGNSDIHLSAVDAATTVLVSRATGAMGAKQDAFASGPAINDAGTVVSFATTASNLGGSGGVFATYVRRTGPADTLLPFGAPNVAYGAALDDAGSYIAAYARDDVTGLGSPKSVSGAVLPGGPVDLVSAPPGGPLVPRFIAADYAYYEGPGNALSADGRFAVFASRSPALAPDDAREANRCFRRDLQTGVVVRVSGGPGEPATCSDPQISADGSKVAFRAPALLVPDGAQGTFDAFVRDVPTGALAVASRADGVDGVRPNASVLDARMSADGRRVAFITGAANLGVPGGKDHVFVRDLVAGTTVVADRATGVDGVVANDDAEHVTIDADGSRVAFTTTATNLGDGDADVVRDVFVRDVDAATTQLVSRRSDSDDGVKSTNLSTTPWISGDGDSVVFRAYGQNLDTSVGAWPTTPQLVERDLVTRTTRVVSRDGPGGALLDASLGPASLTHDGGTLAYEVRANVPGGVGGLAIPDGGTGIVLRDLGTGTQSLVTASVLDPDMSSAQGSRAPALNPDGSCLLFTDRRSDLVPGVSPDFNQIFLRILRGDCGTTPPAVPNVGGGPVAPPPTAVPISRPVPAPKLSKVSLLRSRFRVGAKATAKTASARRRKPTPTGTAFRFTLDRQATMRFVIERRTTGRRVGKSCRKATRALRNRKKCVRYVKVGTLTRRNLKAGRRSVAFSGRIAKKRLRVGRYRVSMQATGTTGRRSATSRRTFTVVSR
jgi:Tol biopolymer transport system component